MLNVGCWMLDEVEKGLMQDPAPNNSTFNIQHSTSSQGAHRVP